MELRQYQQDCLGKIFWELNASLPGNSICVLPTGSGKSVIIANLAKTLDQPILILQPSKEILEQNLEKLCRYVDRSEVGIYSASMDEKTINHFTFATIGSIYKKPELFAHFRLILIDECHLVNPKNLEGMFTSFLHEINEIRKLANKPPVKCIGFTATPYRMCTGYISLGKNSDGSPILKATATTKIVSRLKEKFWQRILVNVSISDLIEKGFLCPLEYIDLSMIEHAEIPVNKSESDFDLVKYEKLITSKLGRIKQAIEFAEQNSKSVLVFCSSVKQATELSYEVLGSAVVTAKTPPKERDLIIDNFRNGITKTVFNVGVLTIGFDKTDLDCIVLLRPTRSIGLYYQMLGRGVRIAPGKTTCRVIDLTSTVKNLGRIESIKLAKVVNPKSGWSMWEILSETGSWHARPLYSYVIGDKEGLFKQTYRT